MTIIYILLWVLFVLFFSLGYDSEDNDITKTSFIKATLCLLLVCSLMLFDVAEEYLLIPHLKDENQLLRKENERLNAISPKPCPE